MRGTDVVGGVIVRRLNDEMGLWDVDGWSYDLRRTFLVEACGVSTGCGRSHRELSP